MGKRLDNLYERVGRISLTGRKAAADSNEHEEAYEQEESRYPFLRTISGLLSLCAAISVVSGVISAIVSFLGDSWLQAFVSGLAGLIGFVIFQAFSEGLIVLIDIERNTRVTADRAREKSV